MPIADESMQIIKARRKLEKQLEQMDQQFTQSALKEAVEKMYQRFTRTQTENRTLSSKEVTLFSENSEIAEPSQALQVQCNTIVKKCFDGLDMKQVATRCKNRRSLEGRISKSSRQLTTKPMLAKLQENANPGPSDASDIPWSSS